MFEADPINEDDDDKKEDFEWHGDGQPQFKAKVKRKLMKKGYGGVKGMVAMRQFKSNRPGFLAGDEVFTKLGAEVITDLGKE